MNARYQKIDKILLASALFLLSGAILAYNLRVIGDGTLTVSLQELTAYALPPVSAISEAAAAHLTAEESIFTAVTPSMPPRDYELLEPIVKLP